MIEYTFYERDFADWKVKGLLSVGILNNSVTIFDGYPDFIDVYSHNLKRQDKPIAKFNLKSWK